MSRRTILFVYHRGGKGAGWIDSDLSMLGRHYSLLSMRWKNIASLPKLVGLTARSDIVFAWFAYGHSFAAVIIAWLLHRKCIVVVGGGEVTWISRIRYGRQGSLVGRMQTKICLLGADMLIAVSQFTAHEILRLANPKKLLVIHNAVDVDFFSPLGERKDLALMVCGGALSRREFYRKGVDVLLRIAENLPAIEFVLVGGFGSRELLEKLHGHIPDNVRVLGWIQKTDLQALYRTCKVYCQLSAHEAFGVALAEAMACGCIPVVSDRGALPEVVGDCGYVIPYGHIGEICTALVRAMQSSPQQSAAARNRAVECFSLEKREKTLLAAIRLLGQV